jgi:hypothetical protein
MKKKLTKLHVAKLISGGITKSLFSDQTDVSTLTNTFFCPQMAILIKLICAFDEVNFFYCEIFFAH